MTLAIGLVGLGYGEQVLHKALLAIRGVKTVAVACSTTRKAEDAARRLGIPRSAGSWQQLIDDPAVQAVVIAVPPRIQERVARRALALKKPVFCEKPLAATEAGAARLTRLARKSGAVCAVDFEFPEIGAWKMAKAYLKSGRLGTLRGAEVRWQVETYAVKTDSRSWKTESSEGGGALNNFASHTFHYLEWFLGPITGLNCSLQRAAGLQRIKGETGADLWIRTRAGVPVSARILTHASGCAIHEITFFGSKGTLRLANAGRDYAGNFKLTFRARDARDAREERVIGGDASDRAGDKAAVADGRIRPVSAILKRWTRAISHGLRCEPGFEEGLRVQRLIARARRSDRLGKWVNCA